MDRLETVKGAVVNTAKAVFTFQYGQIRNSVFPFRLSTSYDIYIPVWIDQKLQEEEQEYHRIDHLHSSMDRLETNKCFDSECKTISFTFQYGQIRNTSTVCRTNSNEQIYIPVWIDQKRIVMPGKVYTKFDLHSSMDRLETIRHYSFQTIYLKFTFQYGQIRNQAVNLFAAYIQRIYIPVWIDQKQLLK